jgi:type IV fimbrial biogenesis protein FimT
MEKRMIKLHATKKMIGVTLIELLVTLVVLSILITIGVPSFQDFMRSSRLSSVTNELSSALNIARSEAVRRGKKITVCMSDANQSSPTCDGTSWAQGWLVFAGDVGDETTASNLIKVGQINGDGVVITTANDSVSFSANGVGSGDDDFSICIGDKNRLVKIGTTGRISVSTSSCP